MFPRSSHFLSGGSSPESKLHDGIIFGDGFTSEYVYMPASEIGLETPRLVFENQGSREDISIEEGLDLIRLRSLRPIVHPDLGERSI